MVRGRIYTFSDVPLTSSMPLKDGDPSYDMAWVPIQQIIALTNIVWNVFDYVQVNHSPVLKQFLPNNLHLNTLANS